MALVAARMTWATKERDRGLARPPRSRMRPGLGRKSKGSSWVMVGRLRRRTRHSSSNHRTSHYSAEKLALFDAPHLASAPKRSPARCKNQRADKHLAFAEGCKRQFALILPSGGRVASPPGLTVKRTKIFAMLRKMIKPLITVSGRSVWHKQAVAWFVDLLGVGTCGRARAVPRAHRLLIDRQAAQRRSTQPWLMSHAHLRDQSSAIPLPAPLRVGTSADAPSGIATFTGSRATRPTALTIIGSGCGYSRADLRTVNHSLGS